jgi:hypothetical protein
MVNPPLTNIVATAGLCYVRAGPNGGDARLMQQALKGIFFIMPFLFGIGFIAPVTAELIVLAGIEAPLGLTPLVAGLLFGGAWGLYATIKGSWL